MEKAKVEEEKTRERKGVWWVIQPDDGEHNDISEGSFLRLCSPAPRREWERGRELASSLRSSSVGLIYFITHNTYVGAPAEEKGQ